MPQSDAVGAPVSPRPRGGGFTLIELLVVISIIAVLTGLLLPAVNLVRERSRRTESIMVVGQLAISLETYCNEDPHHAYPLQGQLYPTAGVTVPQPLSQHPQGGAAAGVLALLLEQDAVNLGNRHLDTDGCMIDPWLRRYRYQLLRPAPTTPGGALQDWNWNTDLARPKRWNERTDTPGPFPYVWSLGRSGSEDDAATWAYDPKS